jgi:type I restriction enzyme R subunit
MVNTNTKESGFQELIIKELVEKQEYIETLSNDFDREYCLNKTVLFDFIKTSQPENYDFLMRKGEKAFLNRLDDKIHKEGIIEVLRKGVKHLDKTIMIFYPKPNSAFNKKDQFRYDSNIFSVAEELVYSEDNQNRIDLVISLNGLPIITMELKNAFTNQAVKNAIIQYRNDRNPKDKIFNFARCLVHFAMDTDLAFMTTKLEKQNTHFLPFNKGLNDGRPEKPFGAGNPVNQEGIKTSYIWNEVFTKDSLSNIIEKFVYLEKPKTREEKAKLIFPRYHQLKVVRNLLTDAKEKGIGEKYLIQHSAGSGKSNSITWLAHQLIGLFDKTETNPLFDSVVVVTDRTILDKQIRDNIKNFAQVKNVVEAVSGNSTDIQKLDPTETSMSKTTHMRLALENNKRIIICTVQTFPYVVKAVQDMESKNIAFIIDEAHSSQSGIASASMNALFSGQDIPEIKTDEEGNIDSEDLVNYLMQSRKMLKNASYFAFTATPKNKTLETFGVKQLDGSFKSFHTYSMKQAIEEEYILDVLQNFTTYKSYYKIKASSDAFEDKEYETKKANKKLKWFVEGDEHAIYEKSKIMIDHFNKSVRHLINGKAKAMIVTKSIIAAMKYKDAFDKYLGETKLPYKAIVAFSGTKKHYKTGEEMSESDMNKFSDGDNNIPNQFKKDAFKFLIVANKFQTGFDQPLLHTMYVDKLLVGVQAVQTLSRLNRAYKPYKKDTMVLDFYNDAEGIKEAFADYYTTTILSEETDVNKLNDLQDELDKAQIYANDDAEKFFILFYKNANRNLLDPIIDNAVAIFESHKKEDQIKFKSTAKTFVRTYSYLSKIIDFEKAYWEKLWLFLKHLTPKLKIIDEIDENILEDIDMSSYRTNVIGTTKISLEDNEGLIEPIPVESGGGLSDKIWDSLKNIVAEFNRRFGDIDWGADVDKAEAESILVSQIPEKMKANLEILKSIMNSDKDNAKDTSDKEVRDLMQSLMFTHTGVYRKFVNDKDFKNRYLEFVFDIMWNQSKSGVIPKQQ